MGNFCVTESDSKVPNAPCIFPFKHKGVVYEGCPVDSSDKTRRWCSTKIDKNGKHVNGNYGFCSKNCPIELVKGLLLFISMTKVRRFLTFQMCRNVWKFLNDFHIPNFTCHYRDVIILLEWGDPAPTAHCKTKPLYHTHNPTKLLDMSFSSPIDTNS